MSLDLYFKRNIKRDNPSKEGSTGKIIRFEDDVEVYPGYFVRKKLYDKMFEHQKEGVKWLFSLHEKNKGAVLADDMGLGKTIQTIALLASLFRYKRIKHVLIIAPTTLLINWRQEFKKWADFEIFITTIDGNIPATRRLQLIDSVQATEGILMLTYNLARSLKEELSKHRNQNFFWDYLILDEAHKIKNQSKTTKELNQLPSRLRLGITGTPVQNNLSELWSIYNFCMQGTLLGTYATFKRIYEKPITTARKKDSTIREKILGNKIAESLRKIYEPYILRRTKEEIFGAKKSDDQLINYSNQNLPPKYDWCVWIKMNQTQIKLYEDFLNSDEVKEILSNRTAVKSPLMQLLVLKKICDHPRLLSKNTFEKLIYNENIDLEMLNTVNVPVDILIKESSKLSVLSQLLKILVNEKHKILLFSSSTKMLDIIEKVLKINRISFCRLDGQVTSNEKRQEIVKRFRSEASISLMILTVQVGGVGLTLTEADRVIIYDCSWNPGTDSQAVDRAYRIGQKNLNVIVYRFMTSTGVEEKIYSRQVFKDSLTKQTIGKENDPARYFTSTDLFELFKIGDFTKSKVCDQFNELHGTLEDKLVKQLADSDQLEFTEEQQSVLRHKEQIKKNIPEIYDISEHSLLFSKKIEILNTSDMEFAYMNNEVKTAKEMITKESQLASGSDRANLENDILSAKQRHLTQQFGVEFLPLGQNFNKYREGRKQFELNRPKLKSPVKIVNLDDDDDDEIQFIDKTNNRVLPPLNIHRPTASSKSQSSNNLSELLRPNQKGATIRIQEHPILLNDRSEATHSRQSSSSSSLQSILTDDYSLGEKSDSNQLLNNQSDDNLTDDLSTKSSSNSSIDNSFLEFVAPSPVKKFSTKSKEPQTSDCRSKNNSELLELSLNSSSIMDAEDNELNNLITSFDSSIRFDDNSTQFQNKNNQNELNQSFIVLD